LLHSTPGTSRGVCPRVASFSVSFFGEQSFYVDRPSLVSSLTSVISLEVYHFIHNRYFVYFIRTRWFGPTLPRSPCPPAVFHPPPFFDPFPQYVHLDFPSPPSFMLGQPLPVFSPRSPKRKCCHCSFWVGPLCPP